MWHKIGIPSIIGVGALLLMTVPTHFIFLTMTRRFRKVAAFFMDKRMQHMNELISGIQVIKE